MPPGTFNISCEGAIARVANSQFNLTTLKITNTLISTLTEQDLIFKNVSSIK